MCSSGVQCCTHPPLWLYAVVFCLQSVLVIRSNLDWSFLLKKKKIIRSHWPTSWLWKEQLCFRAQPSKPLLTSVDLDGLEKRQFVLMKALKRSTTLQYLLIYIWSIKLLGLGEPLWNPLLRITDIQPQRAPVLKKWKDNKYIYRQILSTVFSWLRSGCSCHLSECFADSNHYPPGRPIWILPVTCGLAKQSEYSPDGLLECKPCPFSFFFL